MYVQLSVANIPSNCDPQPLNAPAQATVKSRLPLPRWCHQPPVLFPVLQIVCKKPSESQSATIVTLLLSKRLSKPPKRQSTRSRIHRRSPAADQPNNQSRQVAVTRHQLRPLEAILPTVTMTVHLRPNRLAVVPSVVPNLKISR